MGWFIVICELLFWVFVVSGLFTRYVLKWKKTSAWLFFCTILADVVLLIIAIMDLSRGETAQLTHALAAVYIGISIVYGRRAIQWADDQFVRRVMKISRPAANVPRFGKAHAKYERQGWYRHWFAWAIGNAIILLMIWLVGDFMKAKELIKVTLFWSLILCGDFLWSFSYTIWPRKAPQTR
ncbi:hypothetical protein [Anoxybacteroides tepidamans]|uniref:hypothetical protein n=1 Tax=Anoxybacteroides tepidamans TaxID=265948 RepID=UPI000B1E369E|nr:hypothetical protein [Anoxybacillus tepidamans]